MKKLTALLACVIAIGTLSAAPSFRVDITGLEKDAKVKIHAAKADGNTAFSQVAGWRAEADRPYCLTTSSGQLKGTEWSAQSTTFKAEESGTVTVQLCGQWAKEANDREWLLIADVKVNGKLVENGDFAKTATRGDKVVPENFVLSAKAEFMPTAGPNGKGAVKVNHDNRLSVKLAVEAGQTYTISVQAKPAL